MKVILVMPVVWVIADDLTLVCSVVLPTSCSVQCFYLKICAVFIAAILVSMKSDLVQSHWIVV